MSTRLMGSSTIVGSNTIELTSMYLYDDSQAGRALACAALMSSERMNSSEAKLMSQEAETVYIARNTRPSLLRSTT